MYKRQFLAKTAINSSQEIDLKNGAEREKDLLGLAFATRDKHCLLYTSRCV